MFVKKIIFIFVVVFLVLLIFYFFSNHNISLMSTKQKQDISIKKTFVSQDLGISFQFSQNFQIEEKFRTIYLVNNTEKIVVDRIATNFGTLDEYLEDLTKRNNISLISREIITINNEIAEKVMIRHPINSDTKSYYFFKDNWVYDISTSSPELYDDLDQIAQSFRYTP